MNEEDFKNKIEERWGRHGRHRERSRVWSGLFLLVVGGLLLARASGVFFPDWFFTWPVLLIGIGLMSGIRHKFRSIGWLFPIAVGGIFLIDRMSPDINLRPYLWPILFIAAGVFIMFRPRGRHCRRGGRGPGGDFTNDESPIKQETVTGEERAQWQGAMNDRNDVIDVTAVFGGVKKNVLSKNFKGGDVVAFMGGTEINLTQADFNGRVMIDTFNMFGGTKLIIPADWEVQSDIVAIFGGVDDKRPPATNAVPNKVLHLDGTCIFGGLEIKSY